MLAWSRIIPFSLCDSLTLSISALDQFFLFQCLYILRVIEEIKQKCAGLELQNEDIYMVPKFGDFVQMVVRKHRGEDKEEELVIDYVSWFLKCYSYVHLGKFYAADW